MTSLFHTSLSAKTAHRTGAGLGVRSARPGSDAAFMWGYAGARTAIVEAANDLDALAARCAG
jgi:hypothetical protein